LLVERVAALTHRPTWLAVQAERAVSRALGGSCSVPLAAHAQWRGDMLELQAALGHAEAPRSPLLRVVQRGAVDDDATACALGVRAAAALRELGADAYLAALPVAST
jgi:hydroxymethylbilane synthase